MYHPVECSEIIERVEHIRGLFRPVKPASEEERHTYERRERRLKDFVSNLRRTNGRAMAQMLNELETLCLLTRDGGYRLFGYSLDALRGYDLYLNGGRTHIEGSHQRLCTREIHCPLSVRRCGECQRQKHRDQFAKTVQQVVFRQPEIQTPQTGFGKETSEDKIAEQHEDLQ